MIENIISFSIKNKFVVVFMTVVLIGVGVYSMLKIPLDAVPDITNNQVQVITVAPDLATNEVEQFITYPIELSMSNLPDVEEIRSVSRFGLSVVTIVFDDDMGTYLPRQLVGEALASVKEDIPRAFGEPFVGPISTGLGEIYQYALEVQSDYEYSATELRTMQDWIVKRQMAMLPGVVEVNSFGGKSLQYEVAIDPSQLHSMGVTVGDIYQALESNNQNSGGAYIEKNHKANFIRIEGLMRSMKDIESVVVKNINGIPICIKDVAKVQEGHSTRYGAFTKDGQGEAVGGMVLMLKGANSNEVITAVKARMEQIQKSLPEGVKIVPFLDRSKLIGQTTKTVSTNLMEGGLIVIFVLVLLLGNWRGGMIVASTIPLSLLFAFILMYVFDVWANLMSLGAIDFGIIVDGAVIIVESTVFAVSRQLTEKNTFVQADRDKVALKVSTKMMNSAFFGQLIILIVFLPILTLEGVEGKMFKPMALTFAFAILGAMLLCLTYVPMMSAFFIRPVESSKVSIGDKIVLFFENIYEKYLLIVLSKRKAVLSIAMLLFGGAVVVFLRMGGEFMPKLDEGDIAFHVMLRPGSALSETVAMTTAVEKRIKAKFPDEIEHVMSRIGVADVPTDPMPMDIADVIVILRPKNEWTAVSSKSELVREMKKEVAKIPGVNYEFTQPIEMRFNELISGVREDIAVKIYGEDLEVLAEKAAEAGKLIAGIEGVGDLRVEATTGQPQLTVAYKRDKIAQYGLNIADLNKIVSTAFAGGKAGVIFKGERRFDLVIRMQEAYRRSINDVKLLYVDLPNGSVIPLKEVADIAYKQGAMQIGRDNTHRRTYVGVNVRGRDIESVVKDIESILDDKLGLPAGYYIQYGGAFENLERARGRLQWVVPMVLVLIFILVFFALKSTQQTVMIYMAIPLAVVGGVFALTFRGMPFSISAGIGFIVLFGVAVLNGLVLISGFNELKEEGKLSLKELIIEGSKRRIRPILLTASTDILGFLPMAVSASAGAEVQRPLATVVIGGLFTSTILTLFILPLLYQWIEERKQKQESMKPNYVTTPTLTVIVLITIVGLFLNSQNVIAQSVDSTATKFTLEQALSQAKANYPTLKISKLELEKQKALRKTGLDLGMTDIFTSADELGTEQQAMYNLFGVSQTGINLFGARSQNRFYDKEVESSALQISLTELELEKNVRLAWIETVVRKRKIALYHTIDTIYQGFLNTAKLRFETNAISELEYYNAQNKNRSIDILLIQARRDYQRAIKQLQQWTLSDQGGLELELDLEKYEEALIEPTDLPVSHPMLLYLNKRREVAEEGIAVANSELLPKFNIQYSQQQVEGNPVFYGYQAGISVPLWFKPQRARVQAAKIDRQVAEENIALQKVELRSAIAQLFQEYHKWKDIVAMYEDGVLKLSKDQVIATQLGYFTGGIDYINFSSNMFEALEIQLNYLDAVQAYFQAQTELQYALGEF